VNAAINPTNGRITGYYNLVPQHGTRDLGSFRIDHDFTDRDRYYLSFNTVNTNSDGSAVASPFMSLGLLQRSIQDYTVANSYAKIVTPRLVNEVRGGINFENNFSHGNLTLGQFMQSVGFNADELKAYGCVVGPAELDTYGQIAISPGQLRRDRKRGPQHLPAARPAPGDLRRHAPLANGKALLQIRR